MKATMGKRWKRHRKAGRLRALYLLSTGMLIGIGGMEALYRCERAEAHATMADMQADLAKITPAFDMALRMSEDAMPANLKGRSNTRKPEVKHDRRVP